MPTRSSPARSCLLTVFRGSKMTQHKSSSGCHEPSSASLCAFGAVLPSHHPGGTRSLSSTANGDLIIFSLLPFFCGLTCSLEAGHVSSIRSCYPLNQMDTGRLPAYRSSYLLRFHPYPRVKLSARERNIVVGYLYLAFCFWEMIVVNLRRTGLNSRR